MVEAKTVPDFAFFSQMQMDYEKHSQKDFVGKTALEMSKLVDSVGERVETVSSNLDVGFRVQELENRWQWTFVVYHPGRKFPWIGKQLIRTIIGRSVPVIFEQDYRVS